MSSFTSKYTAFAVAFVAFLGHYAEAGRSLRASQQQLPSIEVERTMLAQLAGGLKSADGSSRLEELEEALLPMYTALPKDEHGLIGRTVVRYALHRLFMQRRSWFIRGLDPSSDFHGKKINPPSAIMALEGVPVLPSLLQDSVARHHSSKGFTLRETAALAAALEDYANREAVEKLKMSYDVLGLPVSNDALEPKLANLTVATYMTIYLLGHNFSNWTVEEIRGKEFRLLQTKRWRKIHRWAEDVQARVSNKHHLGSSNGDMRFNETVHVVEALSEEFGVFNDQECRELKHTLLELEGRKPGRVRLSDFYNASRYGVWGFSEHVDYLRVLGALDESNASNPQVIVPNYVNSMPQCLRASSIYSTCCRNQCEDLMATIETSSASSEASPKRLATLVASLSTDTSKDVPRQLSDQLLRRLHEVAENNGGKVPIHGRLFAQWMHHAFPRECPYPHKAGTTTPYTPDEWIQETGKTDSQASDEEMSEHIRPDDSCPINGLDGEELLEEELPWSYAEELITSIDLGLPSSSANADLIMDVLSDWQTGEGQPVDYLMMGFIGVLVSTNVYFFIAMRGVAPTKLSQSPFGCSEFSI